MINIEQNPIQSSKTDIESSERQKPNEYKNLLEGAKALRGGILAWEAENPNDKSFIIIAGPSGSGKGKLEETINFSPEETTFLNLDRYYFDADFLQERDGELNFSTPLALNEDRLKSDLEKIISAKIGEKVIVPVHSMKKSKQIGEEELEVKRRIVINGVYALRQALVNTPFKVYMDAPENVLLGRKTPRDVLERGVSEEVVKERFRKNVLPALKEHVIPQKELASIIIHNELPIK